MMLHLPLKQSGLTLIELVITISIAAILLSVAVPSMVQFLNQNAVRATCSELADSLNMAKAEGVKRSAGGTNLVFVAPACSKTWSDGWYVFLDDQAAPNQCFAGTADSAVQRSTSMARDVQVSLNLVQGSANASYVGFNGQGLPRSIDGAFIAGQWTCSKAGVSDSTVTISSLGRVRSTK
jgi:type IV fimbrial biogenesis protein FimT